MTTRLILISTLMITGCLALVPATASTDSMDAEKAAVLDDYVERAEVLYGSALTDAKGLQKAVKALISDPGAQNLQAARDAWLASRPSYAETEVYRFGNKIVEDWTRDVDAWPLDEGYIDYVDPSSYGTTSKVNPYYTANVIANKHLRYGDKTIDTSRITPKLLLDTLQEAGDVSTNVATGYHVIEFLLWGQRVNGTNVGAGDRPWTDYSKAQCTNANCDRRAQYLMVVTDLLVDDLTWMAKQWEPNGEARKELKAKDINDGLAALLTGMGSLSYGELAGDRMKLGLLLHDPKMEQDRYSDSTCNDHFYAIVGIRDLYLGESARAKGQQTAGISLGQLLAKMAPDLNKQMTVNLDRTYVAAQLMKKRCDTTETYDHMIAEGNADGNAVVQGVIDALVNQTQTIERVATFLHLPSVEIEGSESLDDPEKIFSDRNGGE